MAKKLKKNKTVAQRKRKEKKKVKEKNTTKLLKGNEDQHELEQATVKSQLLESRLLAAEASKCRYRENTRILLHENESLQQSVSEIEKDAMSLITLLKNDVTQKDIQVAKLQKEIEELKTNYEKEKHGLVIESMSEIEKMQQLLGLKENEVKVMKSELKLMKEFRIQRVVLEAELQEIKEKCLMSEKQYEQKLKRMEEKFFEEKIWLKHDADTKVSELTDKAHAEAINNIDETTKSIYKKNFELLKSLDYYIKTSDSLSQSRNALLIDKKKLVDEQEINILMVEEKVTQVKSLQKIIKELETKVCLLEKELAQVRADNKLEKSILVKKHTEEKESIKLDIDRMHRAIHLKCKENKTIKLLSEKIIDERSEIETFLIESLEYVKSEIARNRSQYKRDAEIAYNKQMRAAHANLADFPKICNFKNSKFSTNSVFCYLKDTDRWDGIGDKVDISHLTWEQREKVLRLLFAKMNGQSFSKNAVLKNKDISPSSLPLIRSVAGNKTAPPFVAKAFLTEADELPGVVN